MPPKSRRPRRYAKKRVMRKRVAKSRSGNVPEWASLSETKQFVPDLAVGTSYNINNTKLIDFPRASAVAQGYQFFRIKRLTFKVQPLLDTFSSAGATQVPYLTWVINKAGSSYAGLNKDWYLENGAKPIRFDDKTITISYAPSILIDATESGAPGFENQPNMPKTSPWLNTTATAFVGNFLPSTVSHTGHYMLVSSDGSTQAMNYKLTMTAEFEFKKPLSIVPAPTDRGYHEVIRL